MAKAKDTLADLREQAQGTATLAEHPPALPADEAALHAQLLAEENAALKQRLEQALERLLEYDRPRPHRPDPVSAAHAPLLAGAPRHEALAINDPAPGRLLWLVSLKGHRSRVVDPERGTPLLLDQLPVWAHNAGEAWMFFQAYNGIAATVHQPTIEHALPAPEAAGAQG